MTALTPRPAHPFVLRALAVLTATLLAACGPTGGGTGTGQAIYTLADFGARPASVCGSPLSSQLSCTPGGVPTGSAHLDGTATVVYTGGGAAGPFTLVLQDNRAELRSRCQATRFDGEWGQAASGDARFFGSWTSSGGSAVQPAQLVVQVQPQAGAPDGLQAWVLDASGAVLLGPLPLQQVPALPTTPPLCP